MSTVTHYLRHLEPLVSTRRKASILSRGTNCHRIPRGVLSKGTKCAAITAANTKKPPPHGKRLLSLCLTRSALLYNHALCMLEEGFLPGNLRVNERDVRIVIRKVGKLLFELVNLDPDLSRI